MFGIDSGELLIIAVVALVVIGPKDLPRAMRTIGNFVGRARGMAKHFRTGFDAMVREAELEDMEKKWKADNERIMREHPAVSDDNEWGKPAPEAPSAARPQAPPAPPPRTLSSGAAPPIPPASPPPGDAP
jgi:sec-independent protein translocase protein TatB